ncbi:MAG: hypothetical protein J3K34DRAFT_473582 [Monoraphidium minutum]|nr:MAG: hypothetical protein J3K34DRAFT_473582 [Monoraphidium minutum]
MRLLDGLHELCRGELCKVVRWNQTGDVMAAFCKVLSCMQPPGYDPLQGPGPEGQHLQPWAVTALLTHLPLYFDNSILTACLELVSCDAALFHRQQQVLAAVADESDVPRRQRHAEAKLEDPNASLGKCKSAAIAFQLLTRHAVIAAAGDGEQGAAAGFAFVQRQVQRHQRQLLSALSRDVARWQPHNTPPDSVTHGLRQLYNAPVAAAYEAMLLTSEACARPRPPELGPLYIPRDWAISSAARQQLYARRMAGWQQQLKGPGGQRAPWPACDAMQQQEDPAGSPAGGGNYDDGQQYDDGGAEGADGEEEQQQQALRMPQQAGKGVPLQGLSAGLRARLGEAQQAVPELPGNVNHAVHV